MKKIYACLIGNWVCLNDDPECKMGDKLQSPYLWFEEEPDIYLPTKAPKEQSLYEMPYVKVFFKGNTYRINPIFIQIVEE